MKRVSAVILLIGLFICCTCIAFADTVRLPIDISTLTTSELFSLDELIHQELAARGEISPQSLETTEPVVAKETIEADNDVDTMSEGEIELSDEAFLKDFSSGLVARWEVPDQDVNIMSDKQVIEYYSMLVNSELSYVSKYSDYSFVDEKLGNYAYAYINGLNTQLVAVTEYKGKDESQYSQYWSEGYNIRARYIYLINKEYGLDIPSTYSSVLSEIVGKGIVYNYKVIMEAAVTKECRNTELEFDTSLQSYLGIKPFNFMNTSPYEIENLTIKVNFIDDKDVVIASGYLISYESVGAGENISTNKVSASEHFARISYSYSFSIQTSSYYETCEGTVVPDIQYSWDGTVKRDGELTSGQAMLEIKNVTAGWEMNTSWSKTLYVPAVSFDVMNNGTGDAESVVVKVVFTNQETKQIWDEQTTYLVSSSGTPLRAGYSKKAFVYSSVGYKSEVTPPELTADIYVNDQLVLTQAISG